jgi:DNA-binding XRE family transcriptional regulator
VQTRTAHADAILIVSGLIVCLADALCMSSPHRIKFGKTIRRLRRSKEWTQETLAERAKLHPTYVGGIERGERNVSLDNIIKLGRALNVHPSALFDSASNE